MTRRAVVAVILLMLAAGVAVASAATVQHATSSQTPECVVRYVRDQPAPDNAPDCTPGESDHFGHRKACDGTDRSSLTAAERRDILARYGVPGWTGADGELDHRIPLFLGGHTDRRNVWPEPGGIPNDKDALEYRVYRMVCFGDPHHLRVKTARRIFLGDWRAQYRMWAQDGVL